MALKFPFALTACTPVLASALLLSAPTFADGHKTEKAHKRFTECAAIRMKEVNLGHIAKEDTSKYTTAIPEGWTVVGGSGGEGHPKLLLCR